MPKDIVLEIDNLVFGYKKDELLYNGFSIVLKRGEVCTVVGPSGSGKSTLFELITKELKPISGSIKTKKIAQIYQDPYSSFHHTYSIINQIEDVASVEKMHEYLEKLELNEEFLHKKPFELSGGQLQRCSILRALLMEPDLLMADEPTSALDNIIQLSVMKLLMKFLDKVGILLITHDEDLARWSSDRVIKLAK
ncbi:MAG: hypothetical protein QG567_1024 [Campylobacterota bacterium]|nr:hypothetical protein [Campylobacterota bacterium]